MDRHFKNPLSSDVYQERQVKRQEDIRGPYFRDQTAIIHSLPFRRLKHKAQVFFSPNNDHVCTRIEHSFHVATIAATISRGLGLDEELAYAIGLAHDFGHAPFGHTGEDVLRQKMKEIGGFIHEIHGLRVADKLGNRGKSLNLTYGVRDGIICHCGESPDQSLKPRKERIDLSTINSRNKVPCSYEGCATRIADRIGYLGRDLEDALYGGFIKRSEVPEPIEKELGETNGEIIDTLVIDVIENSGKSDAICLSDKRFEVLMNLYNFSVKKIYKHKAIDRYQRYCKRIVEALFDYLDELFRKWGWSFEDYKQSPVPLDRRFGDYLGRMKKLYDSEGASSMMIVCDYVAGMTDGYSLKCMREISLPEELCFDVREVNNT